MPFGLGFFATAGAGGAAGSFDLLETQTLTGSQATVTFSSLSSYASTYQHLQVRLVTRDNRTTSGGNFIYTRFNGDSSTNYSFHRLLGTNGAVTSGAAASSSYIQLVNVSAQDPANVFSASVMDILDAFETTKFKTTRALNGYFTNGTADDSRIYFHSGSWRNTNALDSISFTADAGSFVQYSRFSLYGIKAA